MTEIQRTAERKSAFVRARIKKICRKAIIYILLTLGAFSFVLPFLWMLSTSFKEYGEIFTYPITWIPRKWTIENYREVFSVSEYVNLWRGFLNTMLIVVPSTTAGVFSAALAAALGVSQQTVSHYVKGDKLPALDTLANLCRVLDADANDILCIR